MIIRKPYAFLIKHFKKIHIFLLIISSYIFFKMTEIRNFVSEFRKLGSYDSYNEPITKYVTGLSLFALLLIIAGSVILIILLKHKNKPWKMYLAPIISYSGTLFIFLWTKSFFNAYTGQLETTNIRMISDLLFIFYLGQFPPIALYLIRVLGLDIKKFEFNKDEEYLELEQEDQEELEIQIEVDKEGIKRVIKRLFRNVNYVYQEHKKIFNTIIIIALIVVLKNGYEYIFITNKSYKQGDTFSANGYTITINNSYFTDKSFNGEIISTKSDFVVVDLTIKNDLATRELDLTGFHIINGIEKYSTTSKTYETEFQDLGKTYDSVQRLTKDQTLNLIIIYKVKKDLPIDKFVLYYQELDKATPHLRKIKLNIENVSKIKKQKEIILPNEFNFKLLNQQQTVSFDYYDFSDEVAYTHGFCTSTKCSNYKNIQKTKSGTKILTLAFASNHYEGKDMIDFSTKYGKINYIDNDNKVHKIEIVNAIGNTYYGKYLYLRVPTEVEKAKSVKLVYTIRNNQYTYKIK